MPLELDFSPIEPKQKPPSKALMERKPKKKRFRDEIYDLSELRETLFEPNFKKEDDIIICFSHFTKEMIRISDDGWFGWKYDEVSHLCTLYYYKNPIEFNYDLEMEAVLTSNEDIEIHENLTVQESEDLMIRIVRNIYAKRRVEQLNKIDESIKKEAEERRRLEEENEKIDEEFLNNEKEVEENVQTNNFSESNEESDSNNIELRSSDSEVSISIEVNQKANEISSKERKEDEDKGIEEEERIIERGIVFKRI